MELSANKFEVGDGSESERIQVRGALRTPFKGSEPGSQTPGEIPFENLRLETSFC